MSGTVVAALVIVIGCAAAATLGFVLTVRVFGAVRKQEHNEVNSIYFSMVGVLYAILLAFVVVVAWEQFNGANTSTEREVTRLSNLWRDAGGLPAGDRDEIRSRLTTYLGDVIEHEFETMKDGEHSDIAQDSYRAVWDEYYSIAPATRESNPFFTESLTRLNELGEARRLRLLSSQSTIPTPMWILLVGGGCFAIGWLYLFWMNSVRFQAGLIAALGGFTGFVLFLIFALQHPFAGDVAVTSDVYAELLGSWSE